MRRERSVVIPAPLDLLVPLVENDVVAIWIDTFRVESDEIAFSFRMRHRHREQFPNGFDPKGRDAEPPERNLSLEVSFSDRRTATTRVEFTGGTVPAEEISLSFGSGGGRWDIDGEGRVSPLPPAGESLGR